MLNGLDLFSGIGGLSIALDPWVKPLAYCENDRYAQAVLLSRMADGRVPLGPIWDDVRTLRGAMCGPVDIIYGGFPCQDISVAGRGAGLAGERSGLFFEILRLAEETKPTFLFLENVPAIRTRGASRVIEELSRLGYDCRWAVVSAAEVGAHHKRERWFCLAADPERVKLWVEQRGRSRENREGPSFPGDDGAQGAVAHCPSFGRSEGKSGAEIWGGRDDSSRSGKEGISQPNWLPEPDVGRVVNGLPSRVDRIKCLGNAVVPAQAREAFKRLMGPLGLYRYARTRRSDGAE